MSVKLYDRNKHWHLFFRYCLKNKKDYTTNYKFFFDNLFSGFKSKIIKIKYFFAMLKTSKSFKNLFFTLLNRKGKTYFKASAGFGFKGPEKRTYVSGMENAKHFSDKAFLKRKKKLVILLRSSVMNKIVKGALRGLIIGKAKIVSFVYYVGRPHNGCKRFKMRRL